MCDYIPKTNEYSHVCVCVVHTKAECVTSHLLMFSWRNVIYVPISLLILKVFTVLVCVSFSMIPKNKIR